MSQPSRETLLRDTRLAVDQERHPLRRGDAPLLCTAGLPPHDKASGNGNGATPGARTFNHPAPSGGFPRPSTTTPKAARRAGNPFAWRAPARVHGFSHLCVDRFAGKAQPPCGKRLLHGRSQPTKRLPLLIAHERVWMPQRTLSICLSARPKRKPPRQADKLSSRNDALFPREHCASVAFASSQTANTLHSGSHGTMYQAPPSALPMAQGPAAE